MVAAFARSIDRAQLTPWSARLALAVAIGLALPTTAPALEEVESDAPVLSEPLMHFSASIATGVPVGIFDDLVDTGFGFAGAASFRLPANPIFGLTLSGGWIQYGSETFQRPLVSGRILVDVETDNNLAWFGAGPQVLAPQGFIRPYGYTTLGFSVFFTDSSLEGVDDDLEFARTTNFRDTLFSWIVGGGTLIPLTDGITPISLDLSAEHVWNSNARYLKEGSIIDNPDGSITLTPIESDANLLVIRIGVAFGHRP